jgi:hypothetical protein
MQSGRLIPMIDQLGFDAIGNLAAVHAARDAAVNQRDNLCGCFWAWVALRAFDVSDLPDEEEAARIAGCVVPTGPTDPAFSLPWKGAGVTASWPYRLSLPTSADERSIGVSAHGVARAVDVLSEGRLVALPYRADRWTAPVVEELIARLIGLGSVPVLAVANVATEHFNGSTLGADSVINHILRGESLPQVEPDWRVGHFCSLAGVLRGPAAELVVIRDTYRAMGWRGYHVQTYAAVASALDRDGTGAGGVMLITTAAHADAVRGAVQDLALLNELWDNGSPLPA